METPDFALRGAGDAEPRFMRDLRDVDARVERNGDVSYRWRDGGEAFRDLRLRFATRASPRGSSSRAKWGNEVKIHAAPTSGAYFTPCRRTWDTRQQSGAARSAARPHRRTGTRTIAGTRRTFV